MKRMPKRDPNTMEYDLSRGVTQSMLQTFTRCRVACRLSLDRWQSGVPGRATEFGSLFHALLQKWYGGLCHSATPEQCFREVAIAWEKRSIEVGDDVKHVQADLGMAKALFPAYVQHYAKSDKKRIWVEVEQVFDLPPHPTMRLPLRIRGKVDGVFRYEKTKSPASPPLWVLETKTASQIDADTLSQALAFDFQCLFYLHALSRKLKQRFAGVLYNVIRKPSIGRGDDKCSSDYVKKIQKDIAERPDWYFARFELSFPKEVQDRFLSELSDKMLEFVRWMKRGIPTYKNEHACRGKWNCEYLPICAAGGDPLKAGFKRDRVLFRELEED